MPRKSESARTSPPRVDGRVHRLIAPADLSPAARLVWASIVNSLPSDAFRVSDAPLLRSYCEVSATADMAAKELTKHGAVIAGKTSAWLNIQERSIRAQSALALRLRLCPSSRSDPRSIARQRPPTELPAGLDFARLRTERASR
jgi:phage terminase small subunit